MTLTRSLPLAAALILASGAAFADEATDATVRKVEVRKIVLGHGDGADAMKTGVFVSRIQTDGDDPVTSLQVLGSDAQAIEIDDIEDGETRSFELGDGKWMDVTRDGEMLRLDVDGKEIEIPLNPGDHGMMSGLAGLGTKECKIMMLTGDDLPEGAEGGHAMMFIGEDGNVQHPSGGGNFEFLAENAGEAHGVMFIGEDGVPHQLPGDGNFEWTSDDGMAFGTMGKVIVKRIGHDGDEDVQFMTLPGFPMQGLAGHPNLEELEALKDADPAVRAKVLEALHEILGKQHAIQLHVEVEGDVDADADGHVVRVRRTAAPKVEVR